MKLTQAVKMAVKSIIMKKGRSFLTMLGIIIGIASVMTIVSVVSGSNRKQREYYESMGTNRVNVSASYFNSDRSMFEEIYRFCQGLGDIVSGVTPNVYAVLEHNGFTHLLGKDHICPNINVALDRAAAIVKRKI